MRRWAVVHNENHVPTSVDQALNQSAADLSRIVDVGDQAAEALIVECLHCKPGLADTAVSLQPNVHQGASHKTISDFVDLFNPRRVRHKLVVVASGSSPSSVVDRAGVQAFEDWVDGKSRKLRSPTGEVVGAVHPDSSAVALPKKSEFDRLLKQCAVSVTQALVWDTVLSERDYIGAPR